LGTVFFILIVSGLANAQQNPSFQITGPFSAAIVGNSMGVTPGGIYRVTSLTGPYDGTPTVYVNNIAQESRFTTSGSHTYFLLGSYFPTGISLTMKVITSTGKVSFETFFTASADNPKLYGCTSQDPFVYAADKTTVLGPCSPGGNVSVVQGEDIVLYGNGFESGTDASDVSMSVQGVNFPISSVVLDSNDLWEITASVPVSPWTSSQQITMAVNGETFLFLVTFAEPPCAPPVSGDWTLADSCIFTGTSTAPASVIIPAGKVLTLASGSELLIDFKQYNLLVKNTGGVLVKNGATLKQI
jgi:hypothetical protein